TRAADSQTHRARTAPVAGMEVPVHAAQSGAQSRHAPNGTAAGGDRRRPQPADRLVAPGPDISGSGLARWSAVGAGGTQEPRRAEGTGYGATAGRGSRATTQNVLATLSSPGAAGPGPSVGG